MITFKIEGEVPGSFVDVFDDGRLIATIRAASGQIEIESPFLDDHSFNFPSELSGNIPSITAILKY
jgi:hypothetical protein